MEYRAELVILDPILAFMGRIDDTHKSSDARAVLTPIGSMAERTGCAFLPGGGSPPGPFQPDGLKVSPIATKTQG